MEFIIAQILGATGSGSAAIATQMKDKKKYLIFYALCYAQFIISFILLKGYSGAINSFILMILTLITNRYNDKKIPKWLIYCFLVLIFIGIYITYTNTYSLLPAIASILYLLILISSNMKKVRKYSLISRLMWIMYDFVVGAYAAFALDIVSITSSIIAIIRYDKNKPTNIEEK